MYQTAIVFTGVFVLSYAWRAVMSRILYDGIQLLNRRKPMKRIDVRLRNCSCDKDETENKDE